MSETPDTEIELSTDCRHFRFDRPCAPHKLEGVTCPRCVHHDRIERRIAVVKLAATGDVLRTTALLPAIHKRYPAAHVTWITAAAAVDLFVGNPLVDEVWSEDDPRARIQAFDAVLCPDADPRTAAIAAGIAAKERVGLSMNPSGAVDPLNAAADHWFRMGLHDGKKRANTETYQSLVAAVLGLAASEVGEPIL